MKPRTKLIALLLGVVSFFPACSRVRDEIQERMALRAMRRDQAFRNDMAHMANDRDKVYRLDYVLSDAWLPSFSDTRPQFRAMPDGRFDMLPWLQTAGAEPDSATSAIFDPSKRTVTVIGTGPNAAYIESLIEPLRPNKYRSIATKN